MPNEAELSAQLASERHYRDRLAVPAFAGGLFYLLGSIVLAATSGAAPTVGLVQGLKPTLEGVAHPAVSPRAPEVKYISHHAFALIAGSVITGLALGVLTLVLLLLLYAARFRRPETWAAARPLLLAGGSALAVVTVLHQVVAAIYAHNFAVGHDFSNHAVDQALTKATGIVIVSTLGFVAWVALAAGMIATLINTLRVGLLPRWLAILGMFSAVLIFLPIGGAVLTVIPSFWLVATGILFAGRWPNGDPPAWEAGEARPWPTPAERRAEREQAAGGKGAQRKPAPAPALSPAGPEPAPAPSVPPGARRRRRKRGGRG